MEAPEKIYISYEGYGCFKDDSSTERTNNSQIEYTRTDVFIEKACEFLKDRGNEYIAIVDGQLVLRKSMVKHFKNYMKGE